MFSVQAPAHDYDWRRCCREIKSLAEIEAKWFLPYCRQQHPDLGDFARASSGLETEKRTPIHGAVCFRNPPPTGSPPKSCHRWLISTRSRRIWMIFTSWRYWTMGTNTLFWLTTCMWCDNGTCLGARGQGYGKIEWSSIRFDRSLQIGLLWLNAAAKNRLYCNCKWSLTAIDGTKDWEEDERSQAKNPSQT